jgi:hypothetical protein
MIRSQMNGRDVEATYHNTYLEIKTRDSDDFYPVKVVAVHYHGNDDDYPMIIGETLGNGVIHLPLYGKGTEVKWSWPELGMRNIGKGAIYFRRKAQRQFRRGVRENQLSMNYIGEVRRRSHSFESESTLREFFNPTYVTLTEALTLVSSGKASARAFSQHLAVERNESFTNLALNYKGVVVGMFVGDDIHLSSQCNFLLPLLRGLGKGVEVCPQ